jgi:hypothetical protein
MAQYSTRVVSDWSVERAFAFMADARNFTAWDPGVRQSELVQGQAGALGARYKVTLSNLARTVLTYEITTCEAPRLVVLEAKTATLHSLDTVRVEPGANNVGSVIVYEAQLDLRGPLRLFDRGLQNMFNRLGDRAALGLARHLGVPKVAA